jgi:hypothetical protein
MTISGEYSLFGGSNVGVGVTQELSLRVSVATLSRVLVDNPNDGKPMLALERKATLTDKQDEQNVIVRAQPFGGAVRFRSLAELTVLIGDFHFDSRRSQSEGDFRILINPSDWETVMRFCLEHLESENDPVLESDPRRELVEEFADTLDVRLRSDQYSVRPIGFVIENAPSRTENIYLRGHPTVRIYRTFEVRIIDPSLSIAMMRNSKRYSDRDLHVLALVDAEQGGKGRANAVLAIALDEVRRHYLSMPPESRGKPTAFFDYQLDGNVPAVLERIYVPRFEFL